MLGIERTVLDPTVRENLRVGGHARGVPDKAAYVASLAARGEKLIVYVNSREQSVRIARDLRKASPALLHRVAFYNGGLTRPAAPRRRARVPRGRPDGGRRDERVR